MLIEKYISAFSKLNQGVSRGLTKAPHKPILLLALIQAVEDGIISENKVTPSVELISYFRSFWGKLVTTGHTANFSLPFYHLKNEKSGIWKLKPKAGCDFILTSSNSIKSFKSLTDTLEFAQFDDDLYKLLQSKENRILLKDTLVKTYFPEASINIIKYQNDYLKYLENQIMNDSPVTYAKKVKEILKDRNIKDEEVFVRGEAFKKQIPRMYNYTCAITGMRVEVTANISMIDACHIVPFADSYDDTITNGIALCPNMHRAFDRGLISIDENYKVVISDKFVENYSSYNIHQFEKREILLPNNSKYHPSQENLERHRVRFGFK